MTDYWKGDPPVQVVAKASTLPEFALIDAGGGVVVDLDEAGNEVFSNRKVGFFMPHVATYVASLLRSQYLTPRAFLLRSAFGVNMYP